METTNKVGRNQLKKHQTTKNTKPNNNCKLKFKNTGRNFNKDIDPIINLSLNKTDLIDEIDYLETLTFKQKVIDFIIDYLDTNYSGISICYCSKDDLTGCIFTLETIFDLYGEYLKNDDFITSFLQTFNEYDFNLE